MSKRLIATPSFRFLFSDTKNRRETGSRGPERARHRTADELTPLESARFESVHNRHFIF